MTRLILSLAVRRPLQPLFLLALTGAAYWSLSL